MNKKLSIIMLLSCVGNVFSMDKSSTDKSSMDKSSGFTQKMKDTTTKGVNAIKDMTTKGAKAIKELPSVIYCSTVDAAKKVGSAINTKPGVALVSSACTLGGYQVYQLPNVQSAISTAKTVASGIPSNLIACESGKTICTLFSNFGSRAASLSREAVENIAQHKVGACVAGAAAIGGGVYAYQKYKERTAAAAASRRQLEEDEYFRILLNTFDDNVNGVNEANRTPLMYAIESNDLELVKRLLDKGAKVNKIVKDKNALVYAADFGNPDIVEVLLAKGADNLDAALATAQAKASAVIDCEASARTVAEYRAVIKAIEEAKEAASSAAVADDGAAALEATK